MTPPVRRIVSLSAGTSQPSTTGMLAERLTEATTEALAEHGVGAEVTAVELRDIAHDVLNALLTGVRTAAVEEAIEAVKAADGVVISTPVYSSSYSGLLKMFLDILDDGALDSVAVLVGATGGTPRHSLAIDYAIRPLLGYLRAHPMSTSVYAATDDWAATRTEGKGGVGALPERIARAGAEFAANIMRREPRVARDEFDDVPDMSAMLRGL